MIRASEEIERKCNGEMAKECEKRRDWRLNEDGLYYLENRRLWSHVRAVLPSDRRKAVIDLQPVLPKEWSDRKWGHFYRGDFGKLSRRKAEVIMASNIKPDNGIYCPLDDMGRFDLRYGVVDYYEDSSEIMHFAYHSSLMETSCLEGCSILDDYKWVLRCNRDLFMPVKKKPVQCEYGEHGLCFKAFVGKFDTSVSGWAYWEVLESGNTLCDWQHPFMVRLDDHCWERYFERYFNDKTRLSDDVLLEDTMLMFIGNGHALNAEREMGEALQMHGWFK